MTTEIFIENNRVDISADISSLITFAIDDIKNFGTRQTAFSKTIVLPGTTNNNRLFGNIFETGRANDTIDGLPNIGYNFNAAKSAKCLIFQDNLQSFKGTMRMLEIIKDRRQVEYEVALNGEITSLNVALSSAYLDALDFSAYNHDYTVANIVDSWDNGGGSGYYYPLMDVGATSTLKHDWDIRTFRPALYAREYIDKMFAAAGFRYTSALFDTARFKSLIIPYNRKLLVSFGSSGDGDGSSNTNPAFEGTLSTFEKNLIYTTFTSGVFTHAGGGSYIFGGSVPATFRISGFVEGTADRVNTLYLALPGGRLLSQPLYGAVGVSWRFDYSYTQTFNTGNAIFSNVQVFPDDEAPDYVVNINDGRITLLADAAVGTEVAPGAPVVVNDTIAKNIKQIDFLVSIIKLFNLYVYENQFDEKLIYIKPYVDFYSEDSGEAVDWTYKLNRDAPLRIKPMSELTSKTYQFSYKDDSDFYNDLYKKRYNQSYGSYIFDSLTEFASAENRLELIFAPTPLVGYSGEDKIFPTVFKRSGTTEEKIDFVIRILQSKKITGVTSWDIKDGATVLDSLTDYGYAGHFDDPDNPSNDLNFGALKELFFVLATGNLSVTQFNVYWSSYMAEITDKDSKLVTGKFYLTPADIAALDFSKYIHLDGVIYRLQSIVDYNASTPADCEVNLLRCINTIY